MRFLSLIFLSLSIVSSCATTSPVTSEKEKEIALATLNQGIEFYNTGKYIMALKKLLEAEETIPDNPTLHNTLGLVYLAKDRHQTAADHFKKALKYNPDYIEAKNNLGAAYIKLEEWDKAIQIFKDVAQNILYPTPEIPYSNLGWVYYNQNLYKTAKSYFKKALEINPNYLIPIHGLASVYIVTGYQYQAIDFLQHHIEKRPEAAILHADLAKSYESLRKTALAKRSWEVVLKLEPENSTLAKEAQKKLFELR